MSQHSDVIDHRRVGHRLLLVKIPTVRITGSRTKLQSQVPMQLWWGIFCALRLNVQCDLLPNLELDAFLGSTCFFLEKLTRYIAFIFCESELPFSGNNFFQKSFLLYLTSSILHCCCFRLFQVLNYAHIFRSPIMPIYAQMFLARLLRS